MSNISQKSQSMFFLFLEKKKRGGTFSYLTWVILAIFPGSYESKLQIKFVFTFKKQFNSQGKFITEDLAAQTYKEFLQLYNKPIQNCFIACMTNFNYQKVTA